MRVVSVKRLFLFTVTLIVLAFVLLGCVFLNNFSTTLAVIFYFIAIGLSVINLAVIKEMSQNKKRKMSYFLFETFFVVIILLIVLHFITGFTILLPAAAARPCISRRKCQLTASCISRLTTSAKGRFTRAG